MCHEIDCLIEILLHFNIDECIILSYIYVYILIEKKDLAYSSHDC